MPDGAKWDDDCNTCQCLNGKVTCSKVHLCCVLVHCCTVLLYCGFCTVIFSVASDYLIVVFVLF